MTSEAKYCSLPKGLIPFAFTCRVLEYPNRIDDFECVPLVSSKHAGYWIVPPDWNSDTWGAGPYKKCDILRASRIARTTFLPDEWNFGFGFSFLGLDYDKYFDFYPHVMFSYDFQRKENDWREVDIKTLDPSVTKYGFCEAEIISLHYLEWPLAYRNIGIPRIRWISRKKEKRLLEKLLEAISVYGINISDRYVGVLLDFNWNCHACGSIVSTERKKPLAPFQVVDLPTALMNELYLDYPDDLTLRDI